MCPCVALYCRQHNKGIHILLSTVDNIIKCVHMLLSTVDNIIKGVHMLLSTVDNIIKVFTCCYLL